MLKGLHRLWMRGLVRAGKVQRTHTEKMLKSLFAAPKPTPKSRLAPKPKLNARSKTGLSKSPANSKIAASTRAKGGQTSPKDAVSSGLPGKWLASYYSSLVDGGTLPARRLRYYLYLPSRFPASAASGQAERNAWPLIVMLHGCEQTATQFSQGTRMNQHAEQKGYAVLYPEQSLRAHSHRCWKWYDKTTQNGGGDVKMIVGMIEKVAAKHPIDRTRIYICGISAGAAMAHIVALNHPDLIAAIGLHSGPMFGAGHNPVSAYGVMQHGASNRVGSAITEILQKFPQFPHMPALLIQGQADKVVRPVNQTQLIQQCLILNRMTPDCAVPVVHKPGGRAGGRNPTHAYEIGDFYLRKKLLLRVARITELEHAWSGGDGNLAFNSAAGPDASKMLLRFFARHRRIAHVAHSATRSRAFDALQPVRLAS